MLLMLSIGVGLFAYALVITCDASVRHSLETHNQEPALSGRPPIVTGKRLGSTVYHFFPMCEMAHRVTADVIILAAGAAILIVLA